MLAPISVETSDPGLTPGVNDSKVNETPMQEHPQNFVEDTPDPRNVTISSEDEIFKTNLCSDITEPLKFSSEYARRLSMSDAILSSVHGARPRSRVGSFTRFPKRVLQDSDRETIARRKKYTGSTDSEERSPKRQPLILVSAERTNSVSRRSDPPPPPMSEEVNTPEKTGEQSFETAMTKNQKKKHKKKLRREAALADVARTNSSSN